MMSVRQYSQDRASESAENQVQARQDRGTGRLLEAKARLSENHINDDILKIN